MTQPSSQELESAANEIVGKIVFAFSGLEFNLSLCLRDAVAGRAVNLVNPLVERLSFKGKLDGLIEVVEIKFSDTPACVAEFKQWHRIMDALRTKRNSFVHGRWGVLYHAQQVVNVAPGMPSSTPQRESRFSLVELQAEYSAIQSAVEQFSRLRGKWNL